MYDLIIVGTGPAGLTAAIYASRYRLKNLTIGQILGGTITLASKVENYPGFKTISGLDWAQKTKEQIEYLGGQIIFDRVTKIQKLAQDQHFFEVFTTNNKYQTKTIIIATGTERRKLKIPGEDKYHTKGVTYCTTCDAPFFKEKVVAVIGGSDAAVSGAVHTAEFARKVYIIYRKDKLRAEPIWTEQALSSPKITPIYNTNITEILGNNGAQKNNIPVSDPQIDKVRGVVLDSPYQDKNILALDGVFIEIGAVPGTILAKDLGIKLDEAGYMEASPQMETNVEAVFSAGDINNVVKDIKQMIVAAAEGAVAATSAYKYLKGEAAPQILGV